MKLDDHAATEGTPLAPLAAYDASRLNALQHGILSKFKVLPWESAGDYAALLSALEAEHKPDGPTQAHLVEELAGVLWRKRRLHLAEAASYHRGLSARADSFDSAKTTAAALVTTGGKTKIKIGDALVISPGDAALELAELDADQAQTEHAIASLKVDTETAYTDAVALLDESTLDAWTGQLTWTAEDYQDGEQPFTADAASLCRYLAAEMLPWYDERRAELKAAPLVRAQAIGEALDPDKLERLGRYEVHLDRKFERTLSTLLRLQDIARARPAPTTT
jgi:hypothetical protein